MAQSNEVAHSDAGVNLTVYLCLLGLTAATLAAGHLGHQGRVLTVSIALIIAALKASLIGFYFMGLRRERALVFAILAIGLIAVFILFVGIYPDATFRRL